MMLTGVIEKEKGPYWYAACDVIGVYTHGTSRTDAAANLADAIEVKIGRDGFKVRVTEREQTGDDAFSVLVDSDEPEVLAAEVLREQRIINKLTLAEAAKRTGSSSINSYAAYEQGKRAPSLAKFRELLAAVAPDLVLSVVARKLSR